jgi:chromosomal replication initiator protein
MFESNKLWESALNSIELGVSKANFNTWFKGTFIIKESEGVVELGVPNLFVKDWLHKKYHSLILKTLRDVADNVRSVEFTIAKGGPKKDEGKDGVVTIQKQNPDRAQELPFGEGINREDNLNPRYTFETFIIGSFNQLAHAATQAVIKHPGAVYNPLFIYGNTGHGKTHLLQAVGNHIKHMYRDKKVHYVTSEKFTSDYVTSVHSGKGQHFKDKYRRYDVLIMDDIQFMGGKDKTQEELFHLFNALYENNKQIIFSADKHPNLISGLEERLLSRFKQGMIVDIQKPDVESRAAILKAKAIVSGIDLDDETLYFLAGELDGNIRELEGGLNTIICHTQLKNKPLSLLEVKNLVKNISKPKKSISIKDLIKMIADFYNIEEESITNKTRRKEVVKPRQIVMYILREDFSISYPTIGDKLGGRDHTTVIHSCEKIKEEIKTNSGLLQEINQIRSIIKSD